MVNLAAIPTRGGPGVPAANGDDEVDDMNVLGEVGAEPPLVIWNRAAIMLRSWGLEKKNQDCVKKKKPLQFDQHKTIT